MSDFTLIIITALVVGIFSGISGFMVRIFIDQRSQIASKNAMNQQINMAQERSQEILIEAKEKALRIRLESEKEINKQKNKFCLLYTSPSPRDGLLSRMPSSA